MSSILVLRQRDAVHLACDAAAYNGRTGILTSNNVSKCIAMPTVSAAVSCVGPVENAALFGLHLTQRFNSFDDFVSNASECLPEIFEHISDAYRDGDAHGSLYLIGWHERDDRPAAYNMDLWTDGSSRVEQIRENTDGGAQVERFKLSEQLFAGTPIPGPDLMSAAGFRIPADENEMRPELDLLHLMEVQRHEVIEGRYWVGGKCLLTSIDRRGITQRVLHRWAEDQVGQTIAPKPINWRSWRAEREKAFAVAVIPEGMSRLKRDMLEKKLRKGKLRVV